MEMLVTELLATNRNIGYREVCTFLYQDNTIENNRRWFAVPHFLVCIWHLI